MPRTAAILVAMSLVASLPSLAAREGHLGPAISGKTATSATDRPLPR